MTFNGVLRLTRCHFSRLSHFSRRASTFATRTTRMSIPIVDLSMPDEQVGQALHSACTSVGFFYLVNHGVSESLQREVLQQGRSFFNLTCAQKESISVEHSNSYRGYQRLGVNITRQKQDGHEGFDLVSESPAAQRPSGSLTNFGTNPWPHPTWVPQFQPTLEEYIREMVVVGQRLTKALSFGLGLGPDYFQPYFTDPYWSMRVVRYPPATMAEDDVNVKDDERYEYGVGEHTDYGVFTMILCEDVPNTLQIRPKYYNNPSLKSNNCDNKDEPDSSNKWIMVDPIPGGFICNVGDMLARWTNNIYVSTPHRVLRPPILSSSQIENTIHNPFNSNSNNNNDRISVPFFFDPNYNATISPIDQLVHQSARPPCFEPIMFGDHLLAKLSNNFRY